jgi:hypothetical protein
MDAVGCGPGIILLKELLAIPGDNSEETSWGKNNTLCLNFR